VVTKVKVDLDFPRLRLPSLDMTLQPLSLPLVRIKLTVVLGAGKAKQKLQMRPAKSELAGLIRTGFKNLVNKC